MAQRSGSVNLSASQAVAAAAWLRAKRLLLMVTLFGDDVGRGNERFLGLIMDNAVAMCEFGLAVHLAIFTACPTVNVYMRQHRMFCSRINGPVPFEVKDYPRSRKLLLIVEHRKYAVRTTQTAWLARTRLYAAYTIRTPTSHLPAICQPSIDNVAAGSLG